MPEPRQHASTSTGEPQPQEPMHSERVRTLFSLASVATLSTLSRKHEGFPFGSLMPYALAQDGRPIFLISNMAMHTQNLRADSRASLFLGPQDAGSDPLGAARATLVGHAAPSREEDLEDMRHLYLERHPQSRYWVDFSDFSFFQLTPIDVYYVGGFGAMGWVDAVEYASAAPDPLAKSAAGILAHMNQDHVEAMLLLAAFHCSLQATEATMTGVDRLGFTLRLKTAEAMKGARINFPHEVSTPDQTRKVLVEMVAEASSSSR